MVKPQYSILLSAVAFFSFVLFAVEAQTLVYHLEHEWVDIWINKDGTVDLVYDITIVCDSGTLHWVEVGQPNYDYEIGFAFDENNNQLPVADTRREGDYMIRVDLVDVPAGESIRFNVSTNVGHMVWEDNTNPGNVGMEFTPSWYPVAIDNVRVRIVTPLGVNKDNLRTTKRLWNSTSVVGDRFAVYWESGRKLAPRETFPVGVSFPKEYVDHYEVEPGFLVTYGPWIGVLLVLGVVAAVGAVAFRKQSYLKPVLSVEALGIRRGLTAVEASYLLDLKPNMIVTEILYGLLKKRAVWVTATEPSISLKVLKPYNTESYGGSEEKPLRYYEIDFLRAIREDGTLDEEKLAEAITFLGRSVEEKLRGYCRSDTIAYYNKVVEKAWSQVEEAGTSELASKAFDEQLLWLLLHPKRRLKTETAFSSRVFEPNPMWLWFWFGYQQFHPKPIYKPEIDAARSAQPKPAPAIPGAEFANNIATAVENTSNSVVSSLEKFANAIVPAAPPPKTSHKPAHQGSNCVCACAACACACACVSCACACAGGGAG